ncbi:hypothetical protein N185_35560 [Sinorhizobium sp. GW3]|nr:hypothetical protein N185_35560 [Sinorhizobium sp. GW3]
MGQVLSNDPAATVGGVPIGAVKAAANTYLQALGMVPSGEVE